MMVHAVCQIPLRLECQFAVLDAYQAVVKINLTEHGGAVGLGATGMQQMKLFASPEHKSPLSANLASVEKIFLEQILCLDHSYLSVHWLLAVAPWHHKC